MVDSPAEENLSSGPLCSVPSKRKICELSEPEEKVDQVGRRECIFFPMGRCNYGEACPFIHKGEEKAKSNGFERWRSWKGSDKRRTVICNFYRGGCCKFGDECEMTHQDITEESGRKTKRCADFVYKGHCQNEDCLYAHGDHELRTPVEWYGYPGFKRAVCSYYVLDGMTCSDGSYRCFDAHGELDLRREPLQMPAVTVTCEAGASFTCIETAVEIWSSVTEWEQIGELAIGSKVTSSGPPEASDGYVMLPIEPRGAVEMRYLKMDTRSEDSVEVALEFADAHIHLDQVFLSRRYGAGWMHKTLPCRYEPCCPFGKDGCMYVHEGEKGKPRPPYSVTDFLELAKEICTIPRSKFVGCVHSCCEIYSIEEALRLVEWGREHLDGRIYAAFGIHPSTYEQYSPEIERRLEEALDKCGAQGVAWGECGLDYYKRAVAMAYDPSIRDRMKDVFIRQIQVALRRNLPLVVHSRDAIPDTLALLREHAPLSHPVYMHSFMGTVDEMLHFVNEWPNGYVGIAGAVSWPVAGKDGGLADTARALPLDRLLLETDGPFMAPLPHRGEQSHPGMIPQTAAGIARIRGPGSSVKQVLEASNRNFRRFYRLDAAPCTTQSSDETKRT